MSTSIGARALGLIGTLVIVRYLAPFEYGEVSGAAVVVATANQFSTLGVGMYVFANRDASREALFHGTVVHIALGVVALGLLASIAGPIGRLFAMPLLTSFVPGLVVAALIDRISFMPERLLLRDLRFRRVSVVRAAGEVAFTAVSVSLAATGFGAMSIVYGNIVRSALRAIGLVPAAPRADWIEPCRVRWHALKAMIGYGSTVSVGGFASFGARRWDNLLMARLFGTDTMGAYNLAYNLADIPATQVGEQITDVLLASFGRMDPANRAATLVRACRLLALVLFPLAVGLGSVANTIAAVFFVAEWREVAPMLMVLSIISVPRPIGSALVAYLHARNRAGTVLWLEWFGVAVLLTALVVFGIFGPLWACAGVGFGFAVRALAAMLVIGRADHIRLTSFLSALAPPLAACAPMLGAVVALGAAGRNAGWPSAAVLLIGQCAVGAAVYAIAARTFAPGACSELLRLSRAALGLPTAPPQEIAAP